MIYKIRKKYLISGTLYLLHFRTPWQIKILKSKYLTKAFRSVQEVLLNPTIRFIPDQTVLFPVV